MRMMTEYTEAISEDFAQSEALTSYFQLLTRIPYMIEAKILKFSNAE